MHTLVNQYISGQVKLASFIWEKTKNDSKLKSFKYLKLKGLTIYSFLENRLIAYTFKEKPFLLDIF